MNETKNILLKLFVLLTCGVGWSSQMFAQGLSYTVKISGDSGDGYTVTANGQDAKNNGTLNLASAPNPNDLTGITINATGKFVWGPIVDNTNKTITFEISDPVAPQAGKWYRVQILPKGNRWVTNNTHQTTTNMVQTLNGLSQNRRKSQYLYLHQEDTYTNNYPIDLAGYYEGKEALSYIYVPAKGGSASSITLALQTLTGRYVTNQGIQTTGSGAQNFNLAPDNNDGSFSWNGGARPWTNLGSPSHLTFGYSGSNQSQCFYTYFAEVNPAEMFDAYRVNVVGGNDNTTVTYNGSGSHGLNTVYNGGYFFLNKGENILKENFTCSLYGNIRVSVGRADANGVRTLTIREIDPQATEPWTVRTPEGFSAIYQGDEVKNAESFFVRPNATPKAADLEITEAEGNDGALAQKFVWGPIIDDKYRTITYEVRDRATELANGWYQMQLAMPEADIISIHNKIKEEEGNINTSANTLYLAPTVYDVDVNKKFKITGIPNYAGQEATYVKIDMTSASSLTITNTRTGGTMTGNYTFADNKLTVTNWAIDGTAHPLEGPNVGSGSTPLSFALGTVDMAQYDLYKVVLAGEASGVEVAINNSDARGTTTLGNGGYLFMRKGSVPATENFSVAKGTGAVTALSITDDIITLTISEAKQAWTVKINDSNYKVVYNDTQYDDGASVEIPVSADPALAFKTTCTDKFVWGPIVDKKNNTVTFDVREPATNLVAGKWYQLQLSPTAEGTYYNSSNQTQNGNLVEGALRYDPRNAGSQIYLTGANKTSNWTVELMGRPENEAETYLYINSRSGNTTQMMMQNGYFITDQSQSSASASNTNIEFITTNNQFHWKNSVYPWQGLNEMKMALGKAGSNVGPVKFIAHEVPVKAYKVTGISNYKVEYSGDAKVIGSKKVANNYFLFLEDGEDFEKVGDNIDASKFSLRGTDATITGISAAVTGGYTTLTFTTNAPTYNHEIIHRQNRYYDMLETDANKTDDGFIEDGKGWSTRLAKDGITTIREQNTSLFEIPVYLRQGTSMESYLPTNQLNSYQRWYNWDTDGQVDVAVLTSTRNAKTNEIKNLDTYTEYSNGYVVFRGGNSNDNDAYVPTLALPSTMEEYNVGLDISRFTDYTQNVANTNSSAIEPTLGMRIVYQVRDAKQIAAKIKEASDAGKFFEVHDIALPNVQYGSRASRLEDRTLSTTLPLDMDLNNYWGFNNGGTGNANLVPLTQDNQLRVEVLGNSGIQNVMMIPGTKNDASGQIQRTSFNTGHFVLFQYPDDGHIEHNATATINVYMTSGNVEYKLVQFNLTFIGNAHPVVVTELKNSQRHPDALTAEFGAPVTELTFDEGLNSEYSTSYNGATYPDYRYPLDYKGASYAFGARNGRNWAASRGEYALQSVATSSKQTGSGKLAFYPVTNYLRSMKDPSSAFGPKEEGAYELYIDAADQPGKIASIELRDALCVGSRLYCYGYIGCTSGGTDQNPTSVLINVMGINKDTNKEELIYSYCPGIITLRGYAEDGRTIYSTTLGNSSSYTQRGDDANYWAPWQQIGFSFLIGANVAAKMKGYSIQIMNNAYNSGGGDTMLDDFQIYVNPPKGNVDFTTPLCSDKVRHAKIHTDFEMLKNISVINESDPKLSATYCFLDAEIFDNFKEGDLKISDMFEMDDKGNHNLKSGYSVTDDAVLNIINHAFRQALVGSRYIKSSGKEDYGFHSFDIPYNFDDIPTYAYKDSKEDKVYGEVDGQGVRRLVFKENVVRGEMQMKPAEDELHPAYWPYMRPSRTYYLVFSPVAITQQSDIDAENTATQVFGIQDDCSFFGKFTTKDPLHVILDNADIESDLPIRAVCHGEKTAFSFDIPALKVDKPIVDEAYCVSEESLNGKIVPETQGLNHYKYEASFKNNDISGVIKNLPYDWWMGGKYDETHSYRGTIEDYLAATHPTIKYDKPKDKAHKQDGDPVNIAQAMTDFRFFYPDFGMGKWDANGNSSLTDADWAIVTKKDYNSETGYGLLDSEINSIKDLVKKGIIILHRNTYDMPLTYEEAEELQAKELSDMMEKEMNDQILALALELDNDPSIAALLPLKALEGTVLSKLSEEGRLQLTLEELASMTYEQVKGIAAALKSDGKLTDVTDDQINAMTEGELRRTVEEALKAMSDLEMQAFASDENKFPNIGHEKRAYLVVRALNILSRETVAKLPEADQQNTTIVRAKLREQMISIFREQKVEVLRKMWSDTSAKLSEEERAALLEDKDPATMNADGLAVLVEDGLAQLTNNVIDDLKGDRYVHFTLIPIMPSQENFVDEPYIFCPEPRGVKIRITSHEPEMLDGFADMAYPEDMKNVPVRVGLPQIRETKASTSKVLRIPVRGLKKAAKDGEKAVKLTEHTGYETYLFLTETDDPQYQQAVTSGMAAAKNEEGIYKRMVGKVQTMKAVYPTTGNQTPDNYLEVNFENDMQFREGYTYRVGVNFMEMKEVEIEGVKVDKPTISCYGTMLFDMKIVPEYQKWTAAVSNTDWTNDRNWARADRDELNAGNAASDGTKPLDAYITNEANQTANSFVPMYFTNVLIDKNASAPVLYIEKETEESDAYTPASRSGKTFLKGLHSTATDRIIYDMDVAPANGKGTWPVSEGDYECTLFGTYIANGVTFKPQSQLINAQHLTYNKAWVEYELKTGRWYTLSSPLQNTFAGEWYSPKAGGKQLTPHFYDITYQQGGGSQQLNDRFRPAYYQRSWDNGGNKVVYTKSNTDSDNYAYYIAADWSYVYNDVTKEYSNGAFSVMVEDGYMDGPGTGDGKVLNRMPKADTQYTYFDVNGNTAEQSKTDDLAQQLTAKRNRLWSDELNSAGGTFTQTITNETEGNNFFLVANPFMANMDMDKFFAANSEKLESKFWIMTENGQAVSVRTENGWITTSDQVANLGKSAPLQGFFVKGKSDSKTVEVTYNASMQATPTATADLQARPMYMEGNETLTITAQYGDIASTAVVAVRGNATKAFRATEDCETLIDSNIADLPTIYTVASGQAMSVNSVPEINMLPLGIVGEADGTVEVTFSGTEGALYLYDAVEKTTTEIHEGMSVTMPAKTSGRYFLTMETTGIDAITVAGTAKGVYTTSGIYMGETTEGLRTGIYIVDGVKVWVRQ